MKLALGIHRFGLLLRQSHRILRLQLDAKSFIFDGICEVRRQCESTLMRSIEPPVAFFVRQRCISQTKRLPLLLEMLEHPTLSGRRIDTPRLGDIPNQFLTSQQAIRPWVHIAVIRLSKSDEQEVTEFMHKQCFEHFVWKCSRNYINYIE
jgi:hypothetical protein